MKLYIKQKVFSWGDKFNVYDENGNEKYLVRGEILSLGKKLHIYDNANNAQAFIRRNIWSVLPCFYFDVNCSTYQVSKKFSFKPKYVVDKLNWTVQGGLYAHDYTIECEGNIVATVKKKWMTWADTYEIDFADDANELLVLCVAIIIDAVLSHNKQAGAE